MYTLCCSSRPQHVAELVPYLPNITHFDKVTVVIRLVALNHTRQVQQCDWKDFGPKAELARSSITV